MLRAVHPARYALPFREGKLAPALGGAGRAAKTVLATAMLAATCAIGCRAASSGTDRPPEPEAKTPAVVVAEPPEAHGVTISATWVTENPAFTAFLVNAGPACVRSETLTRAPNASISHGYDVYTPSVSQAVLEARFGESARKLGLSVSRRELLGTHASDEAHKVGAFLEDARVRVLVYGVAPSPELDVSYLARGAGAETAGLLAALASTASFRSARVERTADGGVTFTAEMELAKPGHAVVEQWAAAANLTREGPTWIRRYRPEAQDVPAIFIDPKEGRLDIMEMRGAGLEHVTCRLHTSRVEAISDAGISPRGPESDASDDELFRQMMGE